MLLRDPVSFHLAGREAGRWACKAGRAGRQSRQAGLVSTEDSANQT